MAAPILMLLLGPWCHGQQPGAAAVITDQAAPELSDKFSMPPNQFKLADTGRVYFSSGGSSALFQWDHETGERKRLLQTNDPLEVLGMSLPATAAGSLLDTTGRLLQVNAAGHAAILVTAAMKGALDPGSIFLFDGNSYREMKSPLVSFSQIVLNQEDRAAVLGSSNLPTSVFPVQGLYISAPDAKPIEVAVQGKPAPAATGGTYSALRQIIGFNDAGQLAFLADINGGNAQRAIFLYDGSEVRLIAKNGTAAGSVQGLNFDAPAAGVNYILNNNGKVAFRAGVVGGNTAIWVGDASGGASKLAALGEPAGIEELGNCSISIWLRGFNDSDRVLYDCMAMPGGRNALFLKSPSDPAPQVVFKRGQSAGAAGDFAVTQQATLNNAGRVVLLATLTGGTSPAAWFLVPGDTEPVLIAAQGEATPAGGTFGLVGRSTPALINAGDQVVFLADILESNTTGIFSWTSAGGVKPLVTSADALPEGANTVLRAGPASTSDTETLVLFQKAGGQAAYYAAQLTPGATGLRKVVAEFDQASDLGTVIGLDNLAMNAKGEVVFTASLLGAAAYPTTGVLASLPDGSLQKVVFAGESVPGGDTLVTIAAPRLNNQSLIAFQATTSSPTQGSTGQGIFVAPLTPAADGVQAVARHGDAMPGGGTFAPAAIAFGGITLNDSGLVGFRGTADGAMGTGIFVGTAGGPLLKVVRNGDSVAEGVSVGVGVPNTFKLNVAGQVAYVVGLTGGGKNSGVFLASPGDSGYTPQALATNGDTAPVPGSAPKFVLFREDCLELNNAGQVAFWTGLNGASAPGGWFTAWSRELTAARLLQTQLLSNNVRVAGMLPAKGQTALADSGDLAVYLPEINGSDLKPRIVIAAPDGAIRSLAMSGEAAESTGSEFGKLYPALTATPSGRFLFSTMLLNGPVRAGVFMDRP